jgi:uncharacterized protein YdhG (YjbR/CyaY superfamily)
MTVVTDYLASLPQPAKGVVEHMYAVARELAPDATEELSYAMPAFKYRGKGLVAVMVNKDFLSLYPFGAVAKLGLDLSAYECTTGSIHFSIDHPVPDDLLRQIIAARMRQLEG